MTAVLSVPLLDVSLLASLLPPLRRRALAGDLVLLESYKAVSEAPVLWGLCCGAPASGCCCSAPPARHH